MPALPSLGTFVIYQKEKKKPISTSLPPLPLVLLPVPESTNRENSTPFAFVYL